MSLLSPRQHYQQDLIRKDFCHDPAQEGAVNALQSLYEQLIETMQPRNRWDSLLDSLIRNKYKQPITGLYLWGGVGRGKTYLMDVFFHALPGDKKLRAHFHHFMHQVHRSLEQVKGQQDPLLIIAKRMAKQYQVICFDEFFVSDITDAMLLGTLFQALFREGVILVATSNTPPEQLYKNGLQRARFLPAIEEIKQHCRVLNVDAGIDYRLRTLEQAEIYHYPLDEQADRNLLDYFHQLTADEDISTAPIEINGRLIEIRQQKAGILLIDFRKLCDGPRSQQDYMELARLFNTILISTVEQMGHKQTGDDIPRRFLAMVDEFYERNVKLIISATVPLDEIYTQGRLNFEFQRCRSRLTEMQSQEYLALEHLP